jgi:hypothetical protein
MSQPFVASLAKACVRFIGDELYFRKFWFQVFNTPVGGMIVYYNDFCLYMFNGFADRTKALL